MKRSIIFVLVFSVLMCIMSGFAVQAEDFVDIAPDPEPDLLLPYESLLDGFKANHCNPEDASTVNQLIAEAVRLHGIYNSTGIEASYDKDGYLDYALENNIIYDGLFDSYTRDVSRAEAVFVLYNAVPSHVYSEYINDIVLIPDCDPSAGYYNPLMTFYKAGIVTGYGEYGSFRPGASITNKDLADMLKKLVDPSLRETAVYTEYASRQAYYLIDDFIMSTPVRNTTYIGSGWRYDYTGSIVEGTSTAYSNILRDALDTDNISISRQIFPQKDGVLVLEVSFSVTETKDGMTISLDSSDDTKVFTFGVENNRMYCCSTDGFGKVVSSSSVSSLLSSNPVHLRIELDLDNHTAKTHIGSILIGETTIVDDFKDIGKVTISTGVEQRTTITVNNVHLYKNYAVNDVMRIENTGSAPFGYTVSGNITVEEMLGANVSGFGDDNSAKISALANQKSNAHKDFKPVSGLVMLEAYMLLPTENDGAYFTASYKGYPVFTIETRNGKFYYGNKELYDFSENIWQNIHVEADTDSGTFMLRINGKKVADNLSFMNSVPAFDSIDIGITPDEDCEMWFDDIEVYEKFRYDNYVPEPQKLESDYYLSMSSCTLWRNGSHFGWDYIIPHDDITPFLGYYDEGLEETMDWEIKFLAEHGISVYNMCWYAPSCPQSNPVKDPRLSDALHDGYFNAKYSDKVDFAISFENLGFAQEATYDSFVNNIWPFWVEWYLKDNRYFTIDNKPLIDIYQYSNWIKMCYEKPVTSSMTQEEKDAIHKSAIQKAADLYKKMEQDMKAIGYDGLILTFSNAANNEVVASECLALNAAGAIPYSWGYTANTLHSHKALVEEAYSLSKSTGFDLLAMASIGFNELAWSLKRTDLMSAADFKELLYWFRDDYLKRYETKYKNDPDNLWKSKFIQFATWNEFGEGHYISPSNLYGFGYLDAIAEVFGKTEHDTFLDITPTGEQKSRVGHLFPGYRHYIRRKYLQTENFKTPDVVGLSYDLTASNAYNNLKLAYSGFSSKPSRTAVSGITFINAKYALRAKTSTTKPQLIMNNITPVIDGTKYEFLHLKLSATTAPLECSVYFKRDSMASFSDSYKFNFTIKETGVQDYYIPLKPNTAWGGNITALRIDPGTVPGVTVDFYTIELMNYSAENKLLDITIDDTVYTPVAIDEVRSLDRNEIFIAPTEEDHFYRKLHIVYDWNINTGKLRLETPDETVFEFEVGSKDFYINGQKNTLENKFEVYDGCPVIPLLTILSNSTYKYVYDYTAKTLDIYTIDMLTEFLEFENADAESETPLDTFYNYYDGINRVVRVTDPEDQDNHVWFADAATGENVYNYFRTDIEYKAGKTYVVDFDFKLGKLSSGVVESSERNLIINARYSSTSRLETATSNHYDHTGLAAKVKYSDTDGWTHVSYTFTVADDYVTTDIEGNPYNDTINMYLDPANNLGIDFYVDNFIVRTHADPFLVINGNAESEFDDEMKKVITSTSGDLSIETETLQDGSKNRYWKLTSTITNEPKWIYYYQNTTFKAGVTYYYEVDIRLGKNALGKDVRTTLSINPVYSDTLQPGNRNHQQGLGTFTTGNDWVHCKGSFTISRGYDENQSASIAFYSDPSNKDINGNTIDSRSVDFMIDNLKVYTVKPAHFN